MLRLGFHYHVPALARDGGIYTPGYQGRFIDSLAAHCARLTCFLHAPRADEVSLMDYRIQSPAVDLVPIGPHGSVPRRTVEALWRAMPLVRQRRRELDALLIRGPSPLLPLVAAAVAPTPVVLLLVGDYLAGIDDLPQPRWRKGLIRLWARWNRWAQLRVASRSLTFVNSRKLYQELRPIARHLVETRTTTLTSADFCQRDDTCRQRPLRLLYTGRMDRGKGLLQMVEALALLVAGGQDVVLDLVGWPEPNDPILDEVGALARDRGVAGRVFYHGYRPVGPELFVFYRQADVYVIASTSSFEGFPRTIWEAMAHGLPVVATRVGSIPDLLEAEQAAVLVEPRSSLALAEGIARLLGDGALRRSHIARGYALALQNSLEGRAGEIVGHILAHLGVLRS